MGKKGSRYHNYDGKAVKKSDTKKAKNWKSPKGKRKSYVRKKV